MKAPDTTLEMFNKKMFFGPYILQNNLNCIILDKDILQKFPSVLTQCFKNRETKRELLQNSDNITSCWTC